MTALLDQASETGRVPEWDLADGMRKSLRESPFGAGEMAEYLGVSRTTVSAWLSGKFVPRTAILRLWALWTGVSYEWLSELPRLDSNQQPFDYWMTAA